MAGRQLGTYLCLAAAAAALSLASVTRAAEVTFNYTDQSAWLNFPDSVCGGTRQSPINVVSDDDDTLLAALEFSSAWDESRDGTLFNAANTVRFSPTVATTTTNTPFGEYTLQQFHFHWGGSDAVGSEHLVEGKAYSGELHFVHRGTSAANAGDAYAVVGVLLEADGSLQLAGSPWEFMLPVARGSNASVSGIVYSDFLPTERGYYHYQGSLTTPLCNEVVLWFLLEEPVRAPAELFRRLRRVEGEDGAPLANNFRAVQPLNGRVVRTGAGGLASAVASLWLTALASLIGFMLGV